MSTFKDLPQSLIDAAAKILFGEQKKSLTESTIKEDDIPGQDDSAFHKSRKDNSPVSEEQPIGEDEELLYKKAKQDAHSGLPELGEDCGACDDDKHEAGKAYAAAMEAADPCPHCEKAHADCTCEAVKENYASPEPASAIGFREGPEVPKSAEVLHDVTFNGQDREECFRLLVIYPNSRAEIVPSTDTPGAKSIEQLLDLTAGIIDPKNITGEAIAQALAVPAKEPRFRGNDR